LDRLDYIARLLLVGEDTFHQVFEASGFALELDIDIGSLKTKEDINAAIERVRDARTRHYELLLPAGVPAPPTQQVRTSEVPHHDIATDVPVDPLTFVMRHISMIQQEVELLRAQGNAQRALEFSQLAEEMQRLAAQQHEQLHRDLDSTQVLASGVALQPPQQEVLASGVALQPPQQASSSTAASIRTPALTLGAGIMLSAEAKEAAECAFVRFTTLQKKHPKIPLKLHSTFEAALQDPTTTAEWFKNRVELVCEEHWKGADDSKWNLNTVVKSKQKLTNHLAKHHPDAAAAAGSAATTSGVAPNAEVSQSQADYVHHEAPSPATRRRIEIPEQGSAAAAASSSSAVVATSTSGVKRTVEVSQVDDMHREAPPATQPRIQNPANEKNADTVGSDHVSVALNAVNVGNLTEFFDKIDRAANIPLEQRCRTFGNQLMRLDFAAPTLLQFMNSAFYRTAHRNDEERLALLRTFKGLNEKSLFWDWLERGCTWAALAAAKHKAAAHLHVVRKLEIDFVFGVFQQILRNMGAVQQPLKLLSAAQVQQYNVGVSVALGPFGGQFLRWMLVAVQIALPLDMFFALFGAREHWFSERHYRMLQAACQLGYVDDDVRALVDGLEPGIQAQEHDKSWQRAPDSAQKLLEIEAKLLDQPKTHNDRMNKWYEWCVALLPAYADAFKWFMTPVFWVVVPSAQTAVPVKRLHFIDMSAPPFKLVVCGDANRHPFVLPQGPTTETSTTH
jgi:hypothetical protein